MPLRCQIQNATALEILDHGTIAVQENGRRPVTALDVMEPGSFQIEEAALWWMLSLRSLPTTSIPPRRAVIPRPALT